MVTEGSGRPTQPAHRRGIGRLAPHAPGTERCQLGGGGSSQEDADCWRHRKPLLARYFGRALLQRIAVDHGLLGDRRADRLQERRRDLRELIGGNDQTYDLLVDVSAIGLELSQLQRVMESPRFLLGGECVPLRAGDRVRVYASRGPYVCIYPHDTIERCKWTHKKALSK